MNLRSLSLEAFNCSFDPYSTKFTTFFKFRPNFQFTMVCGVIGNPTTFFPCQPKVSTVYFLRIHFSKSRKLMQRIRIWWNLYVVICYCCEFRKRAHASQSYWLKPRKSSMRARSNTKSSKQTSTLNTIFLESRSKYFEPLRPEFD